MNGTPASTGQDKPAAAPSHGARGADATDAYALALPFAIWSVEIAQTMLGMQRELMDLSRSVVRQQQDAMIAALLRRVRSATAAERGPSQDGFAGLARLGLEAFDRMAAALSASNDAGRGMPEQSPASDRSTRAR